MQALPTVVTPPFTEAQWRTLRRLRAHYRQGRDLFNARELARLRFVRWLCQTGHLVP